MFKSRNMKNFIVASPAEIVRAKQKDDIYGDRLQTLWLDVLLKGSGKNKQLIHFYFILKINI